jgi:serine protease
MKGAAILTITLAGCAVGGSSDSLSSTESESFESFRAVTYHEDFEGGVYIVDGDTPIVDDKALYEFWESQQQGALVINRVGQNDDRWTDAQKLNLTYCVSNNFGSHKATVVAALKEATETIGWETMANVNFVYVPAEDANCTKANPNILFPVAMVQNQPYLARAFFPSTPKSGRDVLVDSSSFGNTGWKLSHVLGHELGHVLGFRHEHTRPEAAACFEDNQWRALTPYDSRSIMHYPQCNGGSNDLNWSAADKTGAVAVYGALGSSGGGGSTTGGTAKTDTKSGSIAAGVTESLARYAVKAGTTVTVTMTGSGDPDLYVRFDNAPTTTAYNCRPYLEGADEQCTLTVPATTTSVFVSVRGYAAGTYEVKTEWTAP